MTKTYQAHFPWRSLRVLQLVIFSTSINSVVIPKQLILPFSSRYIKDYSDVSESVSGFLIGALVGSYFIGRGLTSSIWTAAGQTYGYRAVFSLAVLIETVLTFSLGFLSNANVAIGVRLLTGAFSPLSVLSLKVIKHLTEGFGEDFPVVATAVAFGASLGQASGYLLGGFLPYSKENGFIDLFGMPFLLLSIVVCSMQLMVLIFFYLDFPDISAEPTQTPAAPRTNTNENTPSHEYSELSEVKHNCADIQKSSEGPLVSETPDQGNPVTERKEREAEDCEEELPAYLQCYELEEVDASPSHQDSVQNRQRSARVRTPQESSRSRTEKVAQESISARVHVIAQIIQREERKESIGETEKEFRQRNHSEKMTHISFIEDNFQNGSMASICESLDDAFKRLPGDSKAPYYWSFLLLCLSTLATSWVEMSIVVWMPSMSGEDGLSLQMIGVILAGSVAGVWLLIQSFSLICKNCSLVHASLVHNFLFLLVAGFPIFLSRTRPEGVMWVLLLLSLLFAVRYFASFSNAFGELLVSDSVDGEARELAIHRAEAAAMVCKGVGFIGGAAGVRLGPFSQWGGNFLVAEVMVILILLSTFMARSHFPRFQTSPYGM